MILGTGMADMYGNVHIKGEFDFSLIPSHVDENEMAKIWLIPVSDITELAIQPHKGFTFYEFTSWNPESYLFEYEMI